MKTASLEEYQAVLRYPGRYNDKMRIAYDFSELKGKASKEMKQLQKVAKECSRKGAAVYQKRPNIFQKIWRILTNKVKILREINASEEEIRTASMREAMEEGLEDRPYELDIDALKEYPEFSPEIAQEQLEARMKTVEEKVNLDEVIDTAKKWREAQHIKTPVIKAETKEKSIEVNPADVSILSREEAEQLLEEDR